MTEAICKFCKNKFDMLDGDNFQCGNCRKSPSTKLLEDLAQYRAINDRQIRQFQDRARRILGWQLLN